jgi:hypothetical protein
MCTLLFNLLNLILFVLKLDILEFKVLAEGGIDITDRIGNPSALNPSQLLSEPEDHPPAPATPSPSSRGPTSASSVAPPAGPSKRLNEDSRSDADDR